MQFKRLEYYAAAHLPPRPRVYITQILILQKLLIPRAFSLSKINRQRRLVFPARTTKFVQLSRDAKRERKPIRK